MKGDIKKLFTKKNLLILALIGVTTVTTVVGFVKVNEAQAETVAVQEQLTVATEKQETLRLTGAELIADLLEVNSTLMEQNQDVLEALYEAEQHVCPIPPDPITCPVCEAPRAPEPCAEDINRVSLDNLRLSEPVVCDVCPPIPECKPELIPGDVVIVKVEVPADCPIVKPRADRFTPYITFTGVTDKKDIYSSVGIDSELFKRQHFTLKLFGQANYRLNNPSSPMEDTYYCEEYQCDESNSNIFGTYGLSVRF